MDSVYNLPQPLRLKRERELVDMQLQGARAGVCCGLFDVGQRASRALSLTCEALVNDATLERIGSCSDQTLPELLMQMSSEAAEAHDITWIEPC